jgi:hypothetical protein
VAALLTAMGRVGLPLTRATLIAASAVTALVAGVAYARRVARRADVDAPAVARTAVRAPVAGEGRLSPVAILLLVLIAARVFWVVGEARMVPEHMTDAYENWLLRAKVIAELGRVPTDPRDPFYLGGGRVSYPLGTSMLAAWPCLLRGDAPPRDPDDPRGAAAGDRVWDERLCSLVWPIHYLAIAGLLGGVLARRRGTMTALVGIYLLTSLPLLGIHAARSGYADLLVAAHLMAAGLCSWDALDERRGGAWLGAIVNLGVCVLLKREGLPIMLLLTAGTLIASWSRLRAAFAVRRIGLTAAGVGLWGLLAAAMTDWSYIDGELSGMAFHPEVLTPARLFLFSLDTWNLLWWLLAIGLPVAWWRGWRRGRRAPAVQSWLLIGFVAAVFLFTGNARFAVNGMTFDRSMLQIAPMLLACMMLGVTRDERESRAAHDDAQDSATMPE